MNPDLKLCKNSLVQIETTYPYRLKLDNNNSFKYF